MSEAPRSPRRRHILSSINPETAEVASAPSEPEQRKKRRRRRSRSPSRVDSDAGAQEGSGPVPDRDQQQQEHGDEAKNDRTRPRRSRLKLKDPSRPRRRRHRSRDEHDDEHDRSRRRHHRHHHSRRHRHRSPTPPNPFEEPALSPDTAFRESLFDAMADDEGADYWAAVYGQPVHVYANEREQAHPSGPQGELERMTDEDYAAYVRQRMWEKTHAGMLEERARQDEARKQRKESERQRRRAQRDVDESLRRGEERRRRRRWTDLWELYQSAWADWGGQPDKLPWPLESGQADDVSPESVRTFVIHGLRLDDNDGDASQQDRDAKVARLKEERVRWHPDKVQQKAGGKVDEPTMRNVTAIFQIIDRLWGERRPKD